MRMIRVRSYEESVEEFCDYYRNANMDDLNLIFTTLENFIKQPCVEMQHAINIYGYSKEELKIVAYKTRGGFGGNGVSVIFQIEFPDFSLDVFKISDHKKFTRTLFRSPNLLEHVDEALNDILQEIIKDIKYEYDIDIPSLCDCSILKQLHEMKKLEKVDNDSQSRAVCKTERE
ncbi:hypothetical protein [Listeria booriae]|uniref:Uncharacterized protein n=1 Tax=Listeria booriae TaxID=1552123 RepID=A0A7X0XQ90_9LIST|nr:hypothetical protein [Listeria booriae]MBC1778697.1 hypothetical protein [Listeria booriae]MBC2327224.1 hypothetical protein [Listeria booriae]